MSMTLKDIGYIIRFLQNILFKLKKYLKKRRYNLMVNSIIYDLHIKNIHNIIYYNMKYLLI